ncbi:uncharacterized protein UBRO_20843 [Ustilago bromivora]|uniref:Uncharacterized protein n=1 Tax=Ustilago bromivora TaxID=307758 RepID=A0A1K0GA01_9BASI|nr:uncharacterized protein UBRO_20843 [Ustilago bromivora]
MKPQQPSLLPLVVHPLLPPTSGKALPILVANAAWECPNTTCPLFNVGLGPRHPPSQPLIYSSPNGSATWPNITPTTASSMSSMPFVPGMSALVSPSMPSLTATWSTRFVGSNALMAFDLQPQNCLSPYLSSEPSLKRSSSPRFSAPGTGKSSLQPLLSPLHASCIAVRSCGTRHRQLSFWSAWSPGTRTMPSSSSQPPRWTPSALEPLSLSPSRWVGMSLCCVSPPLPLSPQP